MNVILIEKDGEIFEKNVKTLDKLYSICGYRTNKDFEKLYEWEFDKNTYELYGKKTGKKDKENNYVFPKFDTSSKITQDQPTFYGSLCIVKKNSSITLDEWNIFYMSFTTEPKSASISDSESKYSEIDADENSDAVEDVESFKNIHDEELNYEEYEPE